MTYIIGITTGLTFAVSFLALAVACFALYRSSYHTEPQKVVKQAEIVKQPQPDSEPIKDNPEKIREMLAGIENGTSVLPDEIASMTPNEAFHWGQDRLVELEKIGKR